MAVKIIQASTLQDAVYEELVRRIMSGELAPGQKITAMTIAEKLGVSSQPVRGALRRMEAEKTISIHNKQILITEITPAELTEIFEALSLNLSYAVKRATVQRSEETVQTLEDALYHIKTARDADNFFANSLKFFMTVYHESKNPALMDVINHLLGRIAFYRYMAFKSWYEEDRSPLEENCTHMLNGIKKKSVKDTTKWFGRELKLIYKHLMKAVQEHEKNRRLNNS
ncbi:MAG: GntR family transcriptional regulator [Pseudomonadota bacterium]